VGGSSLPADTYKDQSVLITGGGTGLGRAMAQRFHDLGAYVTICGRREDVVAQTAKEMCEGSEREVMGLRCDVTSPEEIAAVLDTMDGKHGLPDVVVNNAAGNFVAPSERLSANAFARVVSIVLNGTANVTLETARRLNKQDRSATFLAITTTYASTGSGFVLPSACAKAGVEAMIKSLAAEWGPKYGHRFVGIAPGPIETEGAFSRLDPTGKFKEMMISEAYRRGRPARVPRAASPARLPREPWDSRRADSLSLPAERSPSQRLGTTDELSNLATFLCSPYASWMSGEVVKFDGGETVALAGEFNALQAIKDEEWDMMEAMIRKGNKKTK